MKINCIHPNCDICSHNPCELKEPCNSEISLLEKEIGYEVKQLNEIRRCISNRLSSDDHYTLPYSTLKRLEYDTMEIIRELRKELQHEIQLNRIKLHQLGENS
ncbi:MAG: hypothetical protein UHM08_09015 [Bacteroidales bacterium]|nr:hypothetical protein [Bacteroidales bacterium]